MYLSELNSLATFCATNLCWWKFRTICEMLQHVFKRNKLWNWIKFQLESDYEYIWFYRTKGWNVWQREKEWKLRSNGRRSDRRMAAGCSFSCFRIVAFSIFRVGKMRENQVRSPLTRQPSGACSLSWTWAAPWASEAGPKYQYSKRIVNLFMKASWTCSIKSEISTRVILRLWNFSTWFKHLVNQTNW